MLFIINEINYDFCFFLLNFILGYDIKDLCNDVFVVLKVIFDFVFDVGNMIIDKIIFKNCFIWYCKCIDK